MKKQAIFVAGLFAAMLMTGCKSQESAYKQAFEKAKAQEKQMADNATTPVAVNPQENSEVTVTPVTTTTTATTSQTETADVRTINGGFSLVKGTALKTYSVVVGSFVTEANALDLQSKLAGRGYESRVVKTNETINGMTGWYRVIASSFDDKASAVQSRNDLSSSYAGAWLLYNK